MSTHPDDINTVLGDLDYAMTEARSRVSETGKSVVICCVSHYVSGPCPEDHDLDSEEFYIRDRDDEEWHSRRPDDFVMVVTKAE